MFACFKHIGCYMSNIKFKLKTKTNITKFVSSTQSASQHTYCWKLVVDQNGSSELLKLNCVH